MPRYVKPPIPSEAVAIIDALGANRARVAVLHWLAQHPNSTATALSAATQIRYETVLRHLQVLAGLGIVEVNEEHSGTKAQTYVVNRDVLSEQLAGLRALLLP